MNNRHPSRRSEHESRNPGSRGAAHTRTPVWPASSLRLGARCGFRTIKARQPCAGANMIGNGNDNRSMVMVAVRPVQSRTPIRTSRQGPVSVWRQELRNQANRRRCRRSLTDPLPPPGSSRLLNYAEMESGVHLRCSGRTRDRVELDDSWAEGVEVHFAAHPSHVLTHVLPAAHLLGSRSDLPSA